MPEYSIPSTRLPATGTWEAAGVPGGIPTRETIHSTITSTGSDQTSEINTALSNCTNGQVVKLAAGTFRCDGTVTIPNGKQVTLRGTRDNDGDWLSIIDNRGGGAGVRLGGQYAYNWPPAGVAVDVTTLTKGSTVIDVDDASYFSAGHMVLIRVAPDPTFPELHVYANGGPGTRGQIVRVVSVDTVSSPNTVTIEAPGIHGDYTNAPEATLYGNQGLQNYNMGIEDLIVSGENSGNTMQSGIVTDTAYGCWVKTCKVVDAENYGINIGGGYGGTYRCEVREGWSEGENTIATSHGGIFIANGSTSTLIVDSVIDDWIFSLLQQTLTSGTVIAYSVWINDNEIPAGFHTDTIVNHDPTPQFTLVEGNWMGTWKSDGYYGGSFFDMVFRNLLPGTSLNTDTAWFGLVGCRNALYISSIGNVIGRTGIGGATSYGNPNISNGNTTLPAHTRRTALSELTTRTNATTGTITAPASHGVTTSSVIDLVWSQDVGGYNVAFCRRGVTVGTVSGTSIPISGGAGDDLPALNADIYVPTSNSALWTDWLDWDSALDEPKTWDGTLTTRTSDTSGVVTLDGGLAADFTTCWNSAFNGQRGLRWTNVPVVSVIVTGVSGDEVTFNTSSATLPAEDSAVTFTPSNFGFQELDLDVLYLALLKGNYYGLTSGSGIPTVESLGGDTLPDSLFLTEAPQSFVDAGLTWPPIDATDPTEDTYELIPAGVAFNLGYFPSSSPGSGSTAFDGSGSTTFTGSGSVTFA